MIVSSKCFFKFSPSNLFEYSIRLFLVFEVIFDCPTNSIHKSTRCSLVISSSEDLILLNNKNKELEEKISRLSPNTLDLDYLDEELIINTGRTHKNELIIKFDN